MSPKVSQRNSPLRIENRVVEKMYRLVFDVKEQTTKQAKFPPMTELGKELSAILKISSDTILKKTEKDFEIQY